MSLLNTLLEKAVILSKDEFEKFEKRLPVGKTIIDAFRDYSDTLINASEIEALKVSRRRPVEIAVTKKSLFTVGTVRAINPTPDVVESAKVPLTWSTKTVNFAITAAINDDNYISYRREFMDAMFNAMYSVVYAHANSIEKQLAAFLSANKWSASLPDSTVSGVTEVDGAYQMNSEDFILKAPVIMQELEMAGMFQDIGNIGSLARRRGDATYGRNNSRDIEQYLSELEYYHSKEITVPVGSEEYHYVVPKGSLGLLNIIESDAKNRRTDKDGVFEAITDPFFGLDWGVYRISERSDQTATLGTGAERAVTTEWHLALDIAPVLAYSSTAGETPIIPMSTVAS